MEAHQSFYDLPYPRHRVLRKLWKSALEVRQTLDGVGRDQSMLDKGLDALTSVKGVIYAIYCVRSRMLYVGQTYFSAMHRYKQHVVAAQRGEGEGLYRAMRSHGWERYRVFCLEKIPSNLYHDAKSLLG